MALAPTPRPTATLDALGSLLAGRRVLVLSGAGVSTESGIPDYRSPASLQRPRRPMRYQQFIRGEADRRRYWARSLIGWSLIDTRTPNRGHQALARLEGAGHVDGILTQNVDGLHQAAGSRTVLELHGSLAAVRCLACGAVSSRRSLQERLQSLNPDLHARGTPFAPDGDAELSTSLVDGFRIADCLRCGGVLKPDVVFFGENVPRARLERAWRMLDAAEVLLVVGSSLTVFSGYRFVARAAEDGKPVAIVNEGPTRGDGQATLKIDGRLGEVLPALAELL